ncbi:hypothetical protein BVH56_01140 [Abyssicoccus albus]|nr:hypothetical protein BVH56_01140 [Abyssicoccus albus]
MMSQGFQFNIIKNDPLGGHKGTNAGSISLENVAPVFIDVANEDVFIDMGGLHARAEVEQRVKWVADKEAASGGLEYYLVWVTTERGPEGPYYAGVTCCYMLVNKEKKRGYKLMHEHVNAMDQSMKHQINLENLPKRLKPLLKTFLIDHDEEMYERASHELKQALN